MSGVVVLVAEVVQNSCESIENRKSKSKSSSRSGSFSADNDCENDTAARANAKRVPDARLDHCWRSHGHTSRDLFGTFSRNRVKLINYFV